MGHPIQTNTRIYIWAQNNGWSAANVCSEQWNERPKTSLTSHVDWSLTLSFVEEKTAKSLPVNLRFCLFVKIQSHSQNNRKLNKNKWNFFSPSILTGQKRDLAEQTFLKPVIVSSHRPKIILSPLHVVQKDYGIVSVMLSRTL